eukprot:4337654-Prorocentrum_lima.AAC.1
MCGGRDPTKCARRSGTCSRPVKLRLTISGSWRSASINSERKSNSKMASRKERCQPGWIQ